MHNGLPPPPRPDLAPWRSRQGTGRLARVGTPDEEDEEPRVDQRVEVPDYAGPDGREALRSVTRGGDPPTNEELAEWADWDAVFRVLLAPTDDASGERSPWS